MMKQVVALLLMLMLVFSAAVLAENETDSMDDGANETDDIPDDESDDSDEEDSDSSDESDESDDSDEEEKDLEIISDAPGATLRLLQLERAILRHAIAGQAVIDYLNENNNTNTSALEDIVAQWYVLIDEVQALHGEDLDTIAEGFVAIKREALGLAKEFREEARTILGGSNMSVVRQAIRDADYSDAEALTDEIRDAKHEFNREKLKRILNHLDVDLEELKEKLESGEITIEDLKVRLRHALNELNDEKHRLARERVEAAKERAEEFREKARDHAQEKRDELRDRVHDKKMEIRERLHDKRMEIREDARDKRIEIRDRAADKRVEMREKQRSDNSGPGNSDNADDSDDDQNNNSTGGDDQ